MSGQELIRIRTKNKDGGKGRRERDEMEAGEGCHLPRRGQEGLLQGSE